MRTLPLAVRAMLWLVDARVREFVAGDLQESFERRVASDGERAARAWCHRQALGILATAPKRRRVSLVRGGDGFMRTLLQDLRYGARMARRQPSFSLVVILTLALAIGANTVIFSFANVLLIRPLPIRDQSSVAWIFTIDPQRGNDRGSFSIPEFLDYRNALTSFSSLGATRRAGVTLTGRGEAQRLNATRASANLIDVWGLHIIVGRTFSTGADRPGAAPEVVLSHHYWRDRFASNPAIVGERLVLDGRPATIVGVLSPEIEIGNLAEVDVWIPLELNESASRLDRGLRVTGRLKPGVGIPQASAEVRRVAQRLAAEHPASNEGWTARLLPTREAMTGSDTWPVLLLLSLVVGFVLLIACANLANLILSRATGRRRELAVRTALGAGRARMIRQMLTENLLYGVLGGAAGLGAAAVGLVAIRAAAYERFFEMVRIDRNVLLFTMVLALLTPFLFSVLPALQATRTDVNDALKDNGTRTAGGGAGKSRSILVVAQLGLAVMLLVLAMLLVQALVAITNVPLGFEPSRLLTFDIDLPSWRYTNDASVTDYYDRMVARLRGISEVDNVAVADRLPIVGSEASTTVAIDGRTAARPQDRAWAVPAIVGDAYFSTIGVALLEGRGFTSRDRASVMPVAVVNKEMAEKYWGSVRRALGGRLTVDAGPGAGRPMQVIGVVSDVRRSDREAVNPQLYLPIAQQPQARLSVFVRARDPRALESAVRTEMRAIDPDVPISGLRPMSDAIDEDLSSSRVLGALFVAFAIVALVLAASGLYAVVSYSATQRTQEIGLRVALGAEPGDIRRMMARQTGLQVVIGLIIGLAGGRALAMGASSLLFQVSPSNPATYVGVAVVLGAVALCSSYGPVRRATRVDPIVSLRLQ